MIYLISLGVFSGIILALVVLLLLVEARVVVKGDVAITINDELGKPLHSPVGKTLLAALGDNGILLPSACGGKGTCGTCKCVVTKGGGQILPTELTHISRAERLRGVRLACQLKLRQDISIHIPPEIFAIKKYGATVVSNENVATFIKELVLRLDESEHLKFEAGAYVQIDIPEYTAAFQDFSVAERYRDAWERFGLWNLKAGTEEPSFRAYSLANPPHEGRDLKFTVRIATPPPNNPDAPPGVGSAFLFSLKPGDRVTLSGPYGDFFAKPTEREMCFVGGGAGMAPMRSHILNQLEAVHTRRRITFWYGARSVSEMFYDEEFKRLEQTYPNFSYHVALSDPQPGDDWDGPVGFIHQVLFNKYLKDHEDPTEIEYYLCGPPPMIDAVTVMLDDLGVEPEMIAYDKFG